MRKTDEVKELYRDIAKVKSIKDCRRRFRSLIDVTEMVYVLYYHEQIMSYETLLSMEKKDRTSQRGLSEKVHTIG